MGTYKSFIIIITICIAVCGGLQGCSQIQGRAIIIYDEENESKEEVKISFFGFKTEALHLTAIETALHDFMEDNPDITLVYEGITEDIYWNALKKRAAAEEMDDIIMVNHDQMLSLASQDKLADLSGLDTINGFNALAKEQFTNPDGSIYFLPICISAYGLFINYDLLQAHKIKIPENLSEFTEVCEYFVSQNITPIIVNNASCLSNVVVGKGMYPVYQNEHTVQEIEKFNRGEKKLAETLTPGLELVETMISHTWIDSKEVLNKNPISYEFTKFAEGNCPFMISGSWNSRKITAMKPSFKFGVHPFPIMEDGSVLVINVDTCISVNAHSSHLEEAKRFVSYLTNSDVIWAYCDSQNLYTPMDDNWVPTDKVIVPSSEYLTNGRSVIGSDFNLTLPLENSLTKCCTQMLHGMNAKDAANLLTDLLVKTDMP